MILIDAGPLVALNDPRDPWHSHCLQIAAEVLIGPFTTTWPCISESMHLLGRSGGFRLQSALWRLIRNDIILSAHLTADESLLTESLMDRYQDLPMDLADATLVAIADYRRSRTIFTLDGHFFAYRLRDGNSLDVVLPT